MRHGVDVMIICQQNDALWYPITINHLGVISTEVTIIWAQGKYRMQTGHTCSCLRILREKNKYKQWNACVTELVSIKFHLSKKSWGNKEQIKQERPNSRDNWTYPYQRTPMGNPYISLRNWAFMGYNPQESHPRTPAKYHWYTVRSTPNCALVNVYPQRRVDCWI